MLYYSEPIIPSNASEMIKEYISLFTSSPEYKMYKWGEKYYTTDNVLINKRRKMVYYPGVPVGGKMADADLFDDPYKANNKLSSSYLKILVDQKNQYLLGNYVDLGDDDDAIKEALGKRSKKKVKQIAKASSIKSVGWAYIFQAADGNFDFVSIPPEEVIPLYKIDNPEELAAILRFYMIAATDADGKAIRITRVELWTGTDVTYYQETNEMQNDKTQSEYRLCTPEEIGAPNPHAHFIKTTVKAKKTKVTDAQSWGAVPFIPLYNNDEQLYDLKPIKTYIDAYDFVMSDFANNLEDFQDVFWILKGYSGEDLDTFLNDLKRYKTLKVGESGDAKAQTIDIPSQARDMFLKRLNDDIFKFGMGVDIEGLSGGSITNVLIKSKYANLDLKADAFETEVTDFVDKLIWFLNKYNSMTNASTFENYEVTYDRSLIINEIELLEENRQQGGTVSRTTQLKNNSYVTDVEKELEQMEEEGVIGAVVLDGSNGG